jgi:hypothetical protein
MAIFTFSMRELCEAFGRDEIKSWFMDYELTDYLTQEEIDIITARGTWSKEKLAEKIIDHYYMHESGQETPALFKHYAKVAMQEIMESKLPLIYSASIEYDPLVNVDVTETYEGNNNTKTENSGDGSTRNSDTPQGNVSKADILSGDYVSSTSGNEYNGQGQSDEKQQYTKTTKGNSGVSATAQKMIEQYRQNIIMIDRDIINDLASIFHGVLV